MSAGSRRDTPRTDCSFLLRQLICTVLFSLGSASGPSASQPTSASQSAVRTPQKSSQLPTHRHIPRLSTTVLVYDARPWRRAVFAPPTPPPFNHRLFNIHQSRRKRHSRRPTERQAQQQAAGKKGGGRIQQPQTGDSLARTHSYLPHPQRTQSSQATQPLAAHTQRRCNTQTHAVVVVRLLFFMLL